MTKKTGEVFNLTIIPTYKKFYNSDSNFGVYIAKVVESTPEIKKDSDSFSDSDIEITISENMQTTINKTLITKGRF